jgi:predicted ATPase
VEAARHGHCCVLTCRGVEAEASLSFSGLSELLAPVLDEVAPLLASPRRRALEVALLLVEPGEAAPDVHAIGLAVLDVLRVLAARAPLMVALDDVQWLDPASAGVLQIALRRLRGEPVGVLITVRKAPGLSVPIELDRCVDEDRLRWLLVGPLTVGATHHLLKDRVGLDLSRPELVA